MPDESRPSDGRLIAAYPQILTADFDAARAFYRDQLGFTVVYEYGDPAFYALVSRDDAHLNLRFVHRHPVDRDLAETEDVLAANLPVRGVEELYREFRDRGVATAQQLTEQPWGTRDFVIIDPDGNRLCFAETLEVS